MKFSRGLGLAISCILTLVASIWLCACRSRSAPVSEIGPPVASSRSPRRRLLS